MTKTVSAAIRRFRLDEEYFFPEGCHIVEVSNSDADDISIVRARVEPGVTTRWHRLRDTTERYVILAGTARVEVGAIAPTEVTTGDVVIIPPGTRQRITNTGATDLLFLAICSPRFTETQYELLPKHSRAPS